MNALREIVRTCSNAHIAHAALASIGGDFAERFRRRRVASRFAERRVRGALRARFRASTRRSDECEVGRGATHGADQPILVGLRYILDNGLRAEAA